MGAVHRLTIEGELDGIARSSEWAAEMACELSLSASTAYAMDVCFEEALANIITHGLRNAPPEDRKVRLSMVRLGEGLEVVIEDQGAPFDPSTAPEHAPAADLENASIGGLGVHLMRKFTRALRYERRGGVNRLTLEFAA